MIESIFVPQTNKEASETEPPDPLNSELSEIISFTSKNIPKTPETILHDSTNFPFEKIKSLTADQISKQIHLSESLKASLASIHYSSTPPIRRSMYEGTCG